MQEQQRQQFWNLVLEKTQQMLLLSQQAEWADLVKTEAERQKIINDFFALGVNEDDSNVIAKGIYSILEADQKITTICQQKMKDISKHMSSIDQGRKASDAYAANSV